MPTTPAFSSVAETPSVFGASQAAAALRQRDCLRVSGQYLAWLEFDPDHGSVQLWRLEHNRPVLVTHPDMNIRSSVNGYGGGALCLLDDCAYVVDGASQQICKVKLTTGSVTSLTCNSGSSFGGLVADPVRNRLLAVREMTATNGSVEQQLVAVDIASGALEVVRQGNDFYSAAVVSDDGGRLAWVTWQLPDMPWQQSRLWIAEMEESGELADVRCCEAPNPASVQQPGFIGNELVVLSDHLGWWQPFRVETVGTGRTLWQALSEVAAEHGNAPWQLGERQWTGLEASGWASVRYRDGFGELWYHSSDNSAPKRLAFGFVDFRALQGGGGLLTCIARRSDATDSVLEIEVRSGAVKVLAGGEQPLAASDCILPRGFRFQAGDGQTVTGFYYGPLGSGNAAAARPPPLIVLAHGGPTSAAYPTFDPHVQFWAHQGFAVAAVNYRGSTGFGRVFRQSLAENWGVSDVEDVQAAVVYLAEQKLADAGRAFVQGRSAGGYTALMALMDSDVFLAGASLFGVSDPARLRTRTHRFESGYLDWLLGDPEVHAQRWHDRTPVAQSDRIACPVIFFQGGQDRVVVPQQTEAMVAALRQGGFKPEYHYFAEEGHGFRQPDRQVFMLERLLAFYRHQCENAGVQ